MPRTDGERLHIDNLHLAGYVLPCPLSFAIPTASVYLLQSLFVRPKLHKLDEV